MSVAQHISSFLVFVSLFCVAWIFMGVLALRLGILYEKHIGDEFGVKNFENIVLGLGPISLFIFCLGWFWYFMKRLGGWKNGRTNEGRNC